MSRLNWGRVHAEHLMRTHGTTDGKIDGNPRAESWLTAVNKKTKRNGPQRKTKHKSKSLKHASKTSRFVPAHSDLHKVELDTITVYDIHGNPERVRL